MSLQRALRRSLWLRGKGLKPKSVIMLHPVLGIPSGTVTVDQREHTLHPTKGWRNTRVIC